MNVYSVIILLVWGSSPVSVPVLIGLLTKPRDLKLKWK